MSILGKLCDSYMHEHGVWRHIRGVMYETEREALQCDIPFPLFWGFPHEHGLEKAGGKNTNCILRDVSHFYDFSDSLNVCP